MMLYIPMLFVKVVFCNFQVEIPFFCPAQSVFSDYLLNIKPM